MSSRVQHPSVIFEKDWTFEYIFSKINGSKARYIKITTPEGNRLTTIKQVIEYLKNHNISCHPRDVRRFIEKLLHNQLNNKKNTNDDTKSHVSAVNTTNSFINATLGRNDQFAKTPDQIFDYIEQTFNFSKKELFDPCPANPTFDGCNSECRWGKVVYVNPPYKEITDWLEKGFEELKHESEKLFYLLPSRTNPNWFHRFILRASVIIFFEKGIKFKNYKTKSPFGIMLVYFDKIDVLLNHRQPKIVSKRLF